MKEEFKKLRIKRNYLLVLVYSLLFAGFAIGLYLTIKARGEVAYVFLLAIGTLGFFFLSLLLFFSPYIRVDEDRIIVHHDLLRKDILFFYDINRVEFENDRTICIYHLRGLTRVNFLRFNSQDKGIVSDFFKELNGELSS